MANEIQFGLSDHQLGREEKGVTFSVVKNGEKAGKLVVSKGGLRWYPKQKSKTNHFINWAKLAELLEMHGKEQK